jgi:MFS family permease
MSLIRRLSVPGPVAIVTVAGGMVTLSLNVLLPVIPILAEKRGPHGIAGAAIGTLFIAMVAGEFVAPWLMSRWNGSRLLVAAEIMIGVSSLTYLIPNVSSAEILAAAFVRGF